MTDLIQRLTQTKQFHENADVATKEVVDALEAAQAEIESLRSQVRIEQLYVQDLAADAERYRGLRIALINSDYEFTARAAELIPDKDVALTSDMVDAAFDAAMKESQQ